MNKLKTILVSALVAVLPAISLSAQNQSDMCLNEYLVKNISDFQDDFGQHNSWFELFNTSYGTVNIGGCFLSNDPNKLTKYIIPKEDILTKIKPRQHVLFWADNNPDHGTFHVNFTLEESDTIYLVASDGRTVIDRIAIRKDLAENQSFGRKDDGIGSRNGDNEGWEVREYTTPSTNNTRGAEMSKSQKMKEVDPIGWIFTLTAMSTVFLALIILSLVFKLVGHIAINRLQKKSTAVTDTSDALPAVDVKQTSAETFAAISLALHLFREESEAHDDESLMLTISHTDRTYSPWSSKIYSLRQIPSIKKNQR